MSSQLTIHLPSDFTANQERLILTYLTQGWQVISQAEWRKTYQAFDLLHEAIVITDTQKRTFRQVYQRQINDVYADLYIDRLLTLADVSRERVSLQASFARTIANSLRQTYLRQANVPRGNLLLAYCLYFWESFATGYAFEVEIFQDLRWSGIVYQAHDIRNAAARLSPYDLKILDLKGDIKSSSSFLFVGRGQGLQHDFCITRLYEGHHQRTLVVMLQLEAWDKIDGETIVGLLQEVTRHFPIPTQVTLPGGTVVITDYQVWKEKVKHQQQTDEEKIDG